MCSVLCNCPGDLRHNSGPLCTLHSSYTSAACSAGLFYCIGQKRHVRHTAVQEMHGLNAATLLVALHISSCTVLNTFAKDCISLALGYYSSSAHELLQTLAHLFAIYGSFCKACNQQAASSWQGTFLHKCMPCHLHSLAHINPHTEVCNGHAVSCLPTVRQGTLHASSTWVSRASPPWTHWQLSAQGVQGKCACTCREVFGMAQLNSTAQTELQALFDIIGTPHWADVEALQSPAWRKYLQRLPGKAPTLYRYFAVG